MTTITFSKKPTKENEDFIAIPRKEYEEFLRVRLEKIPEVELTPIQKKRLIQARANMEKGNYITIDELEQKLGITH